MYGENLYETKDELENLLSLLTYQSDAGKLTMAKARIKSWLEKTNLELRQFEREMDDMAEEHYSMKLSEFGGMRQ